MSPDIEIIKRFSDVSLDEEALLKDRRRPIVLLKKKSNRLPFEIASNNKYLGFMLPYTPLHYLLFYQPLTLNSKLLTPHFSVLVMTSGNLSEEPIVIDNEEAISKLSFADAFLVHDRDIFMRVDDSVIKAGGFIRRARGYAPEPIRLTDDGPDVMGCGADIKNTFTVTRGDYAVVSQHIGDMENIETLRFFEESLNNLKQVYRANPVGVAYDLHPNYLSTQWALKQESDKESQISNFKSQIFYFGIQHHYAHIASVMAEHGIKNKVIGVAFDGTGYGTDGNIWGSEFLVCDINGFERAAHFKYIPLPGGSGAVKECWRTAIAYIAKSIEDRQEAIGDRQEVTEKIFECLDEIGFVERYGRDKIENILKILDNRQFSPLSSGAGRLFDAVSAIAGICDKNTFEGEAAIALESAIEASSVERQALENNIYPFEILYDSIPNSRLSTLNSIMVVDFSKMILRITEDVKRDADKGMIAVRFHNTIVNAITELVSRISAICGIKIVALSGGVFQNNYLLEGVLSRLSYLGFDVYTNEKIPCNDAGISLGQAYIARERLKK